jgi:acetyl-CoA C-acetyltransferase
MARPVFFLGGAQSDFARNLAREGLELADLVAEVTLAAAHDARVELAQIESIHVGNAFGELFTGQAQMGALPATRLAELRSIPAARHEGACASGSLAILAAAAEIEAERYDCVLVVGAEQQRNVPGEIAARHLGTAAWTGHEAEDARYLWPHMFSEITEALLARTGKPAREHLAAIAQKNFANAKKNPNAQTRAWTFPAGAFGEDDALNPVISGHVRRQDCGQMTDGAAAIVLCSARFAEAHAHRTGRSLAATPRLLGFGHRTTSLDLASKLEAGRDAPYLLPHLRAAITDAYRRAELAGPFDLDGIETHDCFSVTEYLALDHLGITAPDQGFRAIEDGLTARDGALPVNPSGGLIGLGHPVGATGVRMALDACRQVAGAAGDMQIEGARRFATLNIGGSTTTVVSLIFGAT